MTKEDFEFIEMLNSIFISIIIAIWVSSIFHFRIADKFNNFVTLLKKYFETKKIAEEAFRKNKNEMQMRSKN